MHVIKEFYYPHKTPWCNTSYSCHWTRKYSLLRLCHLSCEQIPNDHGWAEGFASSVCDWSNGENSWYEKQRRDSHDNGKVTSNYSIVFFQFFFEHILCLTHMVLNNFPLYYLQYKEILVGLSCSSSKAKRFKVITSAIGFDSRFCHSLESDCNHLTISLIYWKIIDDEWMTFIEPL